jgi:hypothetical protein
LHQRSPRRWHSPLPPRESAALDSPPSRRCLERP